jgi:hypothetical protein
MRWLLSSSSDPKALAVVDGTGRFEGMGAHYSRRSPGSRTFTGCGQEIVLVSECGCAVWAVVRQRTPARAGSGTSRGRKKATDANTVFVWRNMLFRNLGTSLSSDLIRLATVDTYRLWVERYGEMPLEPLRTEVDVTKIKSTNPGYCYQKAGWLKGEQKRNKLFLYAPPPPAISAHQLSLFGNKKGTLRVPR